MLQQDREAGARAARREYIKPLVLLLVGGAVVMVVLGLRGADDPDAPAGAVLALVYPIGLAIQLVFGVAGLWIAANLWLGGAGPLGLAILRLAGVYAMTDLIGIVVAPLHLVGWIIKIAIYVAMLAWLFEFEIAESIIVALITFVIKIIATLAIASLIVGLV
jgi:hypothetical protein